MFYRIMKRVISLTLAISTFISMISCSNSAHSLSLSDPNETVLTEHIETENILTEKQLTEYITSEIYLREIIIAEEKITELLLEENCIDEVILCKTVYISEDNIEEFAEHSQIHALFSEEIDWTSFLTKVAVGTGVIVTVVVLKVVGLPDPIASIVTAAADESMKFAMGGAAVGSLFGALTGFTDELDSSGRTSAIAGFALATVGLVMATVSLIAAIPSGGATAISLATGVKLVIAGISTIAASGAAAYSGYNVINTFTSTDAFDIDWDNINWEKLGVSSAQKAIENGADGYMWGAIVGAVYGGAEGYDYYHKYNTPYTTYANRLKQTPNSEGHWSGERGESEFILDNPIELSDGKVIKSVTYKNAVPDFSPYQEAQVTIAEMTNSRSRNFGQADIELAKLWSKMKYGGKSDWAKADVEAYRSANNLTWHEMSNMQSMQLVPFEVNKTFGHYGGVAEYKAMIGINGEADYD